MARLIVAEVADAFFITELDAAELTVADLVKIEREMSFLGGVAGTAAPTSSTRPMPCASQSSGSCSSCSNACQPFHLTELKKKPLGATTDAQSFFARSFISASWRIGRIFRTVNSKLVRGLMIQRRFFDSLIAKANRR